MPVWRNGETRWVQVPVSLATCGFESHHRYQWGFSSVGRASALQAEGRGFDHRNLHEALAARLDVHPASNGTDARSNRAGGTHALVV